MSEEETKATTEAAEGAPAATEVAAPAPASSEEPTTEDGKHVEEENTAHFEPVVSSILPSPTKFCVCSFACIPRAYSSVSDLRTIRFSWIHIRSHHIELPAAPKHTISIHTFPFSLFVLLLSLYFHPPSLLHHTHKNNNCYYHRCHYATILHVLYKCAYETND